jgi:transcriptional regulator
MSTRADDDGPERVELLQGTLDVLILRTLMHGTEHGQGIARAIERTSGDAFLIDHGSLYPALKRLEKRKWIRAEWGVSANGRRARFYELMPAGRRQVEVQTDRWERLVEAMGRVLRAEPAEG